LPGVTIGALIGLWVAAGLTFYTGYAYLQAGLAHARRPERGQAASPATPSAQQPGQRPAQGRT
jgi:hypothetical protein